MKTKTNISDRYVIIMAGGKGERFWPMSREKTPKQLITLLGKRSFLQQAVDRVLPLVPLKNIIIKMRTWDEEAKLPDVPLPGLEVYKEKMVKHLSAGTV